MVNLYTRDTQGYTYKIEIQSINKESMLIYYNLIPVSDDVSGETLSVCLVNENLNTELEANHYSKTFKSIEFIALNL